MSLLENSVNGDRNRKKELLLQKRSPTKKSYPNLWDISVAGHIKAGESVIEGVLREIKEEIGIEAKEKDLQYIATIKSTKKPKNMEFQYVYLLRCNNQIEEYIFEDNEVAEVNYIHFEELEKMGEERVEGLHLHEEEYKKLFEFIRENYQAGGVSDNTFMNFLIRAKKFTYANVALVFSMVRLKFVTDENAIQVAFLLKQFDLKIGRHFNYYVVVVQNQ